jgi:hypothetical protein
MLDYLHKEKSFFGDYDDRGLKSGNLVCLLSPPTVFLLPQMDPNADDRDYTAPPCTMDLFAKNKNAVTFRASSSTFSSFRKWINWSTACFICGTERRDSIEDAFERGSPLKLRDLRTPTR